MTLGEGGLRDRLEEAETALQAIRRGEVDALVVAGPYADQIFSLAGGDRAYRSIVETMYEAAVTVARDGSILFCNQRFCDLLGTPMAATLGQPLASFVAASHRRSLRDLLADVLSGPLQRRLALWSAGVGEIPVQVAGSLLVFDGSTSVCLVMSDLTELESQSTSIRVLRQQQEALERSRAELAAANRDLEAFAYSVSHDLRAPLRSMDGFSHALLETYGPQLDDQAKQWFERLCEASRRMQQLIDDILNLSRVGRVPMTLERVDLSALAARVVGDLRERDPARQVEFTVVPGCVGVGDPNLLQSALENLLGNAWKFTSRRDKARIHFGREEHDGQPAFFVRDDGAGFDPEYADRLFGPFQRLHSGREFPGHGLGLAIVKRIVLAHGGRVWAEGQVDRGATFYFTLGEAGSTPARSLPPGL